MPAGIVDATFEEIKPPALPAPAAGVISAPVTHKDVFGED
jgi:hypothetical protein